MPRLVHLVKAHGSCNDIFIVEPGEILSAKDRFSASKVLCDRSGMFGADGVYFLATDGTAAFHNPDGSLAEVCGNGLRCVGRLLLERYNDDSIAVSAGGNKYSMHWGTGGHESHNVVVRMPHVTVGSSAEGLLAKYATLVDTKVRELGTDLRLTFAAAPNPHIVTVVEPGDLPSLATLGAVANERHDIFPRGVNVSFLVSLGPREFFIGTYERGAGLTYSCGSATVAAQAVTEHLGLGAAGARLTFRSLGGVASAWAETGPRGTASYLEGDATYVYSTDVELDGLLARAYTMIDIDAAVEEIARYAVLRDENLSVLRKKGIASYLPGSGRG